jgi:low affinity Fe/Cu permease
MSLDAGWGNASHGIGPTFGDDAQSSIGGDRRVAEFFRDIARRVTLAAGSWQFFAISLILLALWAISGPLFSFSDTWQLIINTSTTILTFFLGILILLEANRQAKESKVVHDELLEHVKGARSSLVNIDKLSEEEVDKLEEELRARAERAKRTSNS